MLLSGNRFWGVGLVKSVVHTRMLPVGVRPVSWCGNEPLQIAFGNHNMGQRFTTHELDRRAAACFLQGIRKLAKSHAAKHQNTSPPCSHSSGVDWCLLFQGLLEFDCSLAPVH